MLKARSERKAFKFDSDLFDELYETVNEFGFRISRAQVEERVSKWFSRRFPGEDGPEAKKDIIRVCGGATNLGVCLVAALKLMPGSSAGTQFDLKKAYTRAHKHGVRTVTYKELSHFMLACLDVPLELAKPLADLLAKVYSGRAKWDGDTELNRIREVLLFSRATPNRRLPRAAYSRPATPEEGEPPP
jgi:hypothetical protein